MRQGGADLDPPYRFYVTTRRKMLYEILHPETVHGGDRGNQYTGGKAASRQNGDLPDRFTAATAKATGRAERSIQRDAKIGKELGNDTPINSRHLSGLGGELLVAPASLRQSVGISYSFFPLPHLSPLPRRDAP